MDRAFEHLVSYADSADRDVRFRVKVSGGAAATAVAAHSRGIYMRDVPTNKSREFNVTVEPLFLNDDERDAVSKIVFSLQLCLTSSAAWVQAPKHLDLMYMTRGFSLKVSPPSSCQPLVLVFNEVQA